MFNHPNNSTFPTTSGSRLVWIIDAALCTLLTSIHKRSLHLTYVRGGRILALSRNQLIPKNATLRDAHVHGRLTAMAAFSRESLCKTGEFAMEKLDRSGGHAIRWSGIFARDLVSRAHFRLASEDPPKPSGFYEQHRKHNQRLSRRKARYEESATIRLTWSWLPPATRQQLPG